MAPGETADPATRVLPSSEADPEVGYVAQRWQRKRAVHNAFVEWADREGLEPAVAARRLIFLAVEHIGRIQHDRQPVKLGKHGKTNRIVPATDLDDHEWTRWWHAAAWRFASDVVTAGALRGEVVGDDPDATDPLPIDPDTIGCPVADDAPIGQSGWHVEHIDALCAAADDPEFAVLEAFVTLARAYDGNGSPSWAAIDRQLGLPRGTSWRRIQSLKARVLAEAAA